MVTLWISSRFLHFWCRICRSSYRQTDISSVVCAWLTQTHTHTQHNSKTNQQNRPEQSLRNSESIIENYKSMTATWEREKSKKRSIIIAERERERKREREIKEEMEKKREKEQKSNQLSEFLSLSLSLSLSFFLSLSPFTTAVVNEAPINKIRWCVGKEA